MSHVVVPGNSRPTGHVPPGLAQRRCSFCGTPLDVHQVARGGICSSPACRQQHVVAELAKRTDAEAARLRAVTNDFRARFARKLGLPDPQSITLAVVPDFRRPQTKLSRARQREFRAHLVRTVRQVFEERMDQEGATAMAGELARAVQSRPEFPQGARACATCRGYCCRGGGTHAFLSTAVIRSFMARHPGLRWREVVRAYLEKLPAISFEDSCIYHGRRGCGLPGEMRSSTCNDYYCEGLKELQQTLTQVAASDVLVVSASGAHIGRSVLIKADRTAAVGPAT